MVAETVRRRIEDFVRVVGEPYELVEGVSDEGVRAVQHQSLRAALACDLPTRERVLDMLEISWRENQNHGRIRDWGRLACGIAIYLLVATEENEAELIPAADVIVRLSRWRHNDGTGFFVRFVPYAHQIVGLLFRDIGDLYRIYSVHVQRPNA